MNEELQPIAIPSNASNFFTIPVSLRVSGRLGAAINRLQLA